MMKYTLFLKMMEDFYDPRFVFEAKSLKEAIKKSYGWAEYHGFGRSDVLVKETEGNQLNWSVNNNYVN